MDVDKDRGWGVIWFVVGCLVIMCVLVVIFAIAMDS